MTFTYGSVCCNADRTCTIRIAKTTSHLSLQLIKFVQDDNGPLTLFAEPADKDWGVYLLGADPTHTMAGDYACIQVINRRTKEQVAVYRRKIDPIQFGKDAQMLGLYFNEANFEQLDLADAKRPKLTSQQIKRQDPLERIEMLNAFKAPIPTAHYYESGQVPIPEEGEDVIEATPDPSMMDAEIDEKTGLPKTSGEARQHEKQMAAKKAKKPAAK